MSGTLNHQPASIIRTLLVTLGLGTEPSASGSWPIFDTSEPDTPDDVITMYDTAGRKQGRVMSNGELQETHGIQIRVRAANSVTGYAKARALAVAIDQSVLRATVTMGASEYLVQAISRTGDVLILGKESPTSRRSVYTINAFVTMWKSN